ncbi:HNH endonuclease family protein [Leptolyngbya ectocarpi]|nr:hypothetical protein [Leptolyngbya ectocarpi]
MISKGVEPTSLTTWKQKNPHGNYNQLPDNIRRDIRDQALKEQFYLCAYCCQRIVDIDACHNEHLEAQSLNYLRSLDFANIVASCNTRNQCGIAHKSQPLPLTPLMKECEIELKFKISGRVEGLTEQARMMIQVLNLGNHEKNNRSFIQKRKQLSDALLWKSGVNPGEELENEELLELLIAELAEPEQGKLEPFAPVVINILKGWLQVHASNSRVHNNSGAAD